MTTKIKSEGRVGANNSWWVSELLAADCKKSVAPPRMDTMLRWLSWLYEVKKKDEEKRMEVEEECSFRRRKKKMPSRRHRAA